MRDKKPNTLQSKLGFFDEDLKKPSHDKLMLWLNENIEAVEDIKRVAIDRMKVLNRYVVELKYFDGKKQKTDSDNQKIKELTDKIEIENKKIDYLSSWKDFKVRPEKPKTAITEKTWELPITTQGQYQTGSSSKYTVGFVDMAVEFTSPRANVSGLISEKQPEVTGNYYDWIGDIKGEIEITFNPEPTVIYIEVKTEIKSLGELNRQINHYKEYLKGYYYVLCPDNSPKSLLLEQRIGAIDYAC
ncbi:MAG: hypothetical protein ACOYXT_14630 [Bacteroidota bacterium]